MIDFKKNKQYLITISLLIALFFVFCLFAFPSLFTNRQVGTDSKESIGNSNLGLNSQEIKTNFSRMEQILKEEKEKYKRIHATTQDLLVSLSDEDRSKVVNFYVSPPLNKDGSLDENFVIDELQKSLDAADKNDLSETGFLAQRLSYNILTRYLFEDNDEAVEKKARALVTLREIIEDDRYPEVVRATSASTMADFFLRRMDVNLAENFAFTGNFLGELYVDRENHSAEDNVMAAVGFLYRYAARTYGEATSYFLYSLVFADLVLSNPDLSDEQVAFYIDEVLNSYDRGKKRLKILENRYNPELASAPGYANRAISNYYRMQATAASRIFMLTHEDGERDVEIEQTIADLFTKTLQILEEIPKDQEVYARDAITRLGVSYAEWLAVIDSDENKELIALLLEPLFDPQFAYVRDLAVNYYKSYKQSPYLSFNFISLARNNEQFKDLLISRGVYTNDEIDNFEFAVQRGVLSKKFAELIKPGVALVTGVRDVNN